MSITSAPGGPAAEFSAVDGFDADDAGLPPGIGPYKLAWKRLRRNKVALFFGGFFLFIVLLCILAPVYSHDIAHVGPNYENITGTVKVGGKNVDIVSPLGIPMGPTWTSHYLLGADDQGRDVAVRLLYGGRTSLEIGFIATLITMVFATIVGLIAGYFRGIVDGIISRILDVIWAYPVYLLGIALGTILAVKGIGPLKGSTLLVPAVVIGLVYIPYIARPIRAQVLTVREREFIDAARQQGLGHLRIIFGELLPNVTSTIIVFIPLMLANSILTEAGLTFLGAGVHPPTSSWGTMISSGIGDIPGTFHTTLVPGVMLVLAVLSVNVFGDGLRDALDPRAKVRLSKSELASFDDEAVKA